MSEQIAENDNNRTSKIKNGRSLGEIINDFPIVKNLRKSAPQMLGKYNFSPAIIAALKERSEISDSISTATIMSAQEEELIKSSFGSLIEQAVEADINQHVPGLVITRGRINIEASLAEQKRLGIDPKDMGGVFLSYSRSTLEEQNSEKLESKVQKEQNHKDYDEVQQERMNDAELGDYFKDYYNYEPEMSIDIGDRDLDKDTLGLFDAKVDYDPETGEYFYVEDEPTERDSSETESINDNKDDSNPTQEEDSFSLDDGLDGMMMLLNDKKTSMQRRLNALSKFSEKRSPETDLLAKVFHWSRSSEEEKARLRAEDPQLDAYLKNNLIPEKKEELANKLNVYAASQLTGMVRKLQYFITQEKNYYPSDEELLSMAVYSGEAYRLLKGYPELQEQFFRYVRDASKELERRGIIRRSFVREDGSKKTVLHDVIGEEVQGNSLVILGNEENDKGKNIFGEGLSTLRLNYNREERGQKAYTKVIGTLERIIEAKNQERIEEISVSDDRDKKIRENSVFSFNEIASIVYNEQLRSDRQGEIDQLRGQLLSRVNDHSSDAYWEKVEKYIAITGMLPESLIDDKEVRKNPRAAEFFDGGFVSIQDRIEKLYSDEKCNTLKIQCGRYSLDKLSIFGKNGLTKECIAQCMEFLAVSIRENNLSDEEKERLKSVLKKLNPNLIDESGKVNEEEFINYYNELIENGEKKPARSFRSLSIRSNKEISEFFKKEVEKRLTTTITDYKSSGRRILENTIVRAQNSFYSKTDLNYIEMQRENREKSKPRVSEESLNALFERQTEELSIVTNKEELYEELEKAESATVLMTRPQASKGIPDLKADLSKLSNRRMDKYIAKLEPQKLGEISVRINGIQPNTITTSGGFKVTGKAAEQFAESRKRKELMLGLSDSFNDKLNKQDETIHGFIASGATATAGNTKAGALIAKDKIKDKKEEKKSKAKAVEGKKREVEDEER